MHVCSFLLVSEPTGADSGDVLVTLWMEVMRLALVSGWQCQAESSSLVRHTFD